MSTATTTMVSGAVIPPADEDGGQNGEDGEGIEGREEEFDYIFGFGSIINTSTHAPWLKTSSSSSASSPAASAVLPGAVATLSKDFGYARRWNFRSDTGFTALGVVEAASGTSSPVPAGDINGVLFRIAQSMIPGFDQREVGYRKVPVPIRYLRFGEPAGNGDGPGGGDDCDGGGSAGGGGDDCQGDKPKSHKFELSSADRVWLYVPLPSHCKPADENHPLLQSYVDTVLQGCLEWGGQGMADAFLRTTGGWSTYFLNDTPSSRRPWLFRKDYTTIDTLLQKYSSKTHFGDRKHPEEFSSAFHRRMKGTWSLPRRNNTFTGRETELQELRGRLFQNASSPSSSSSQAIVKVEVAGMGGVGKTQLVTEYCYRFFPSEYGLVVWLNAESAEALVADYRQLLMDLAQEDASEVVTVVAAKSLRERHDKSSSSSKHDSSIVAGDTSKVASPSAASAGSVNNKSNDSAQDTDEIVREVKTRLFRSQVPWLLVFDNLEDRSLLDAFVPRGAGTRGHILVTTRLFEMEPGVDDDNSGSLLLGCFSPDESLELLRRAAGSRNMEGEANVAAAKQVCERLGNLPLALGMAAAYMHRCDVDCVEYLGRYTLSENTGQSLLRHGRLLDYSLSVASSLSLSLVAIEKESREAHGMLRVLCFLGPDQITKPLLRHLLCSEQRVRLNDLDKLRENKLVKRRRDLICSCILLSCSAGLTTSLVTRNRRNVIKRAGSVAFTAISTAAAFAIVSISGMLLLEREGIQSKAKMMGKLTSSTFKFSAEEYEHADIVWDILKSYSILTVKEGKGSMHRLLAQALRSCQSDSEWQYNLRICLDAMESMWTFKADQTDTWKGSLHVLEHVKSVVSHTQYCSLDSNELLKAGRLSTEAGVFSAMALNAFIESQQSFELSIGILANAKQHETPRFQKARAEALRELGRVFRYQGKYMESQQSLTDALTVYEKWAARDIEATKGVADTLYELGVLEVKKHNLDTATKLLQQSLDMRGSMNEEYAELTDANSAATLHQLAAICVAKKPPSLAKAESLLQEALGLSRQIGQRAATLKQLARVTIRQGWLDRAESYLEQALDLYIELYGDNKNHINVAGVKFQQGALALQREQWENAWLHLSECLRIRKCVYAYARPVCCEEDDPYPTHLEVSCVLHELARVALAQGYYSRAMETLKSERIILQRLEETSEHRTDRIHQARLTNLTWLRKCAKEMGDEDTAAGYSTERSDLKKAAAARIHDEQEKSCSASDSLTLSDVTVVCRLVARKYALEKDKDGSKRADLDYCISKLAEEIQASPSGPIKAAAEHFIGIVAEWKDQPDAVRQAPLLTACDFLRDVLRANGVQVNDLSSPTRGKRAKRRPRDD